MATTKDDIEFEQQVRVYADKATRDLDTWINCDMSKWLLKDWYKRR